MFLKRCFDEFIIQRVLFGRQPTASCKKVIKSKIKLTLRTQKVVDIEYISVIVIAI